MVLQRPEYSEGAGQVGIRMEKTVWPGMSDLGREGILREAARTSI